MTHRKRQWKDVNQNERNCLNYISKQKYQPNYPSIGYYYIEGEMQDIENPFVTDGYNGEICWFHKNMVYFVPRKFTLTSVCSEEEMNEDKMLEMFRDYALTKGYFRYLNSIDPDKTVDIIDKYLWKMYTHTSDWEYSSLDNIDLYNFKVTYSLI